MHSVSVNPIYQPCEQDVSSFCFLSFLGFFFGGGGIEVGRGEGGERVVRRGKGGSMSFDFRYFSLKLSITLFHMCEPFY